MGVNTQGFLFGEAKIIFSIEKLILYLSSKYENVKLEKNIINDYYVISFLDGDDQRRLSLHTFYTSYKDEGYPELDDDYIILFDLSLWGNSVTIIKSIIAFFGGGYIIENDCTDDYYIIPVEESENIKISNVHKIMSSCFVDSMEATKMLKIYEKIKNVVEGEK